MAQLTQDNITEVKSGFPSDFLPPEVKASKEYAVKWAEAMDNIGLNNAGNGLFPGYMQNNQISRFTLWRSYARGMQSIDKYKPILGINDKKQRKDPAFTSYRVLNWEIMDIASKYVNVLIGKLLKQNNDIGVYAVDKRAQDERRKKRMELQEYVMNKEFLEGVTAKTGVQFEAPVQEDVVPLPENGSEIDVYMQMFYKEDYCMIVQDLLKIINEQDNYNDILAEVARDLVEIKTAATKTYRVRDQVHRRRCVPERMGCSSSTRSNFEDVKWVFEDWDLTIGQFKEIAGDQFTEEEYKKIAEEAGRANFTGIDSNAYFRDNMCYPWDNTKITVKDCVWFSPDWQTEQIGVNSFGNIEVQQKEYDWWKKLEDKGVSEQKFNEVNSSRVVRYSIDNQYQCLWVKGTKFVANYGKSQDILKNESNLGKTIGPYTIYQLKKCIIETIIPTLDNIQIQWLQFQHHAAKSVPAGPAIEFTALQDISLGGASGDKITPKQALQIYFETGVLLWRRRDAAGNLSNFKPIEEMAGGISNAMEKHFNFMIQDINLLRDQIGLNELTDASTPNSEMGKAVASMASGASDDALRPLHFAFDQVNLGTHQRTVMHITGMAATGLAPAYTEAIGLRNSTVMSLLSDLTIHELGVYLMKQPTQEFKQWMADICKMGVQQGSLLEEEAAEIMDEPNRYRAVRLLKMYRQQKQKQAMANEAQKAKIKSYNDSATAQNAAKAQMDADDNGHDKAMELINAKARADILVNKSKAADEAFLENLRSKNARGEALTEAEQERITEMMKINAQGAWQLKVANAKPKPKPAGAKK